MCLQLKKKKLNQEKYTIKIVLFSKGNYDYQVATYFPSNNMYIYKHILYVHPSIYNWIYVQFYMSM